MHTPSQQKFHSTATKNKQPVAQLMTLTLSLVGYGVINQRAYALGHLLGCPVSENTQITIDTHIESECVINATTSSGSALTLSIENSGLYNHSDGELFNYGKIWNFNNNSTFPPQSNLVNDGILLNYGEVLNQSNLGISNLTNTGSLTNSNYLFNDSSSGGTSNLTNSGNLTNNGYFINHSVDDTSISNLTNYEGANLTNDGLLVSGSSSGGTSNLNNFGTLTNNNYLYNESNDDTSSSNLTNYAGANLTNDGYLYNWSSSGGASNLTNSGTLTNNYYLYNESEDANSTSTLINTLGAELINDGHLYNRSYYAGTSNLTNQGTLVNQHSLYNESDGAGSSSTLTNALGASLINDGDLYNRSVVGGDTILNNSGSLTNNVYLFNDASITNSGNFDISTNGLMYNNGSFVQTAGSTIVNGEIYGSGTVDIQGGSLSGAGYIEASTITIGENATVNPGNSPGTLIMVGDVDWSGTLGTDINSSTVYDMLEVQGVITLHDTSTFEFTFDSSYVAVDGDAFDFLSAFEFDFGLGADFASWFDPSQFSVTGLAAGFGWSVSFTDDHTNSDFSYMWLNVFESNPVGTPVSAPTTITLFGLGISLLGLSIRRKKLRTLSA